MATRNASLSVKLVEWFSDELFDVTPQEEIWICQIRGIRMPTDVGALGNPSIFHALSKPLLGVFG